MFNSKNKLSKKQFDEINDIESWLYNYKSIKAAIVNLEIEYKNMQEPTLAAIGYEEKSGATNKFNSAVENQMTRKDDLSNRIESLKNKVEQYDRALKVLNENEYKIIDCFYIQDKNYYEFTCELRLGERTCKRLKRKALGKIAVALHGI